MDSSISFHHLLSKNYVETVNSISKLPSENYTDLVCVVERLKQDQQNMKIIKSPKGHVCIVCMSDEDKAQLAFFSTGNLLDNCTSTPFEIMFNKEKITIIGSEAFYQSFKFDVEQRYDFMQLDPKESAALGRKKQVTAAFGGNFFEDHWNPRMRFIAMLVALHFKLTAHPEIKEMLINLLKKNTLPCEVQHFKNDWTVSEKNYLCGCLATIGLLFIQTPNLDVHSLVPDEYRKHFALDKYSLINCN